MAKFYKFAGVTCLQKNANDPRQAVPPGATDVIDFDESTNASIIAAFDADCSAHSLSGGVLTKGGVAVSFSPDGSDKQTREGLRNNATQAVQDNAAFLAIGAPSNAQIVAQVRALTQQTNRIIKRLVLLASETGKE